MARASTDDDHAMAGEFITITAQHVREREGKQAAITFLEGALCAAASILARERGEAAVIELIGVAIVGARRA
jgi:hypothetical protein